MAEIRPTPVLEMEPEEKEKEKRIKFYLEAFLQYIVNCIDWKDLVLNYKHFTLEQREMLHKRGSSRPDLVTMECITLINGMTVPGRYMALVEAMKWAENSKVVDILNGDRIPGSEKHKALLHEFGKFICDNLKPVEILPLLLKKDIITVKEAEMIRCKKDNSGDWAASFDLLFLLPNRNNSWNKGFIEALLESKQEEMAHVINKDLCDKIEHSKASGEELVSGYFMSCRNFDDMQTELMKTVSTIPENFVAETPADTGSIREHVVTAYGEPSMNNLDEPPPVPPSRYDSLMSTSSLNQDEEKVSNLAPNLDSSIVKPEMVKHSLEVDDFTARKEVVGVDSDSDNEDNTREDITGDPDSVPDEDHGGLLSSDEDDENTEGDTSELKLRDYQLELAENALVGRNTIICAGTGSGKTFVALHIILKHLQQASNGPRKVVFMARTSALIKQQADRCKKYLPSFHTKLLTGENEDSKMISLFIPNYDILCLTPQILVNSIEKQGVKSLTEFSLLILDECHHTKGDEPYNNLMRHYLTEKVTQRPEDLPQILGLTATIGVGKSHTDEETMDYMLRVCACLDVKILSTVERHREAYLKCANEPTEESIKMVKASHDPCRYVLLSAIEETEDTLQDLAVLQPVLAELMFEKRPTNKESQEYNMWTNEMRKAAQQGIEDFNTSRNISACAIYLNNYNAALEVNGLLRPIDVFQFLADRFTNESLQVKKLTDVEKRLLDKLKDVQKNLMVKGKDKENPNVCKVSRTLQTMLDDKGEDSRAMVFVKARATCKALAKFLDTDLQKIGIKASPLYGKDNRGGEEGMTEAVQNDILEKFRNGHFKVLVATSVGVEGIDVPDCNIVLSYNYSGNEITKIQMKGRSRKEGGTNITMGYARVIEELEVNAYKGAMMQRAMKLVKGLSAKAMEKKIRLFQQEEMQKLRFKRELERSKLNKQNDDDFRIQCLRCLTFVCFASDVRTIGMQHIVIDKNMADKINVKPHKSPKKYEGFHKKFKMFCNNCPNDWGIVAEKDGLPCRILKISSMRFVSMKNGMSMTYKKWIDVPYKVPEITADDLPKLLGGNNDV